MEDSRKVAKGLSVRLSKGIDRRVTKGIDRRIAKGIDRRIAKGIDRRIAKGIDRRIAKGIAGAADGGLVDVDKRRQKFGVWSPQIDLRTMFAAVRVAVGFAVEEAVLVLEQHCEVT